MIKYNTVAGCDKVEDGLVDWLVPVTLRWV